MQTALVKPTQYPLEFFCEERVSVQELIGEILEAYTECDSSRKLPPSFHCLSSSMHHIYEYEVLQRAMIKDDVILYGSVKADIMNAIVAGVVEDVEGYLEYLLDNGQTFELDTYWGELFLKDVEYALKAANLCYAQVNGDDPEQWDFYEGGTLPERHLITLYNGPLKGVW